MTQRELAKGAGIAPNTLSALENKGQGMKPDLFIRLCLLVDADPQEVADKAYFEFRKSLGREAAQLANLREAGPAAAEAVPSLEEILGLYDAAAAALRPLLLAVLRCLRPESAASAFLEDRFQELAREPEPPRTPPGARPERRGGPRRGA